MRGNARCHILIHLEYANSQFYVCKAHHLPLYYALDCPMPRIVVLGSHSLNVAGHLGERVTNPLVV